MTTEQLYLVVAPHFAAGIIVMGTRIAEAAPILRWAVGKSLMEFDQYCRDREWQIQRIPEKWQEKIKNGIV